MCRKMPEYLLLGRFKLLRPHLHFVPGKVKIIGAIYGDKVDMGVGNFDPHHGNAAAVTTESLFDGFGDGSCEHQYAVQIGIGKVKEIIDLRFRYYQGMPFAERKDIQKSEETVVFGNLVRWYLPRDDLGKNGHTVIFSILN